MNEFYAPDLIDYFAGQAMQAILADTDKNSWEFICDFLGEDKTVKWEKFRWIETFNRYTAKRSYQMARAMMIERQKP